MPCHSALVDNVVTASEDDFVEDVLKRMSSEDAPAAAIIDGDGRYLGLFSKKVLLKNLIPVSVAMAGGVQLNVKIDAAPGVAKRLGNVKLHKVSEVMDRKAVSVEPNAPIWEGVSLLTRHGSPLCVVDEKGKFHGLITYDSLIGNLEAMKSTDS